MKHQMYFLSNNDKIFVTLMTHSLIDFIQIFEHNIPYSMNFFFKHIENFRKSKIINLFTVKIEYEKIIRSFETALERSRWKKGFSPGARVGPEHGNL